MSKRRSDLLKDARELVTDVVSHAILGSKAFYSTQQEQEFFVSEFLVVCAIGFGLIPLGCLDGKTFRDADGEAFWNALGKEFIRFDPKHLELFERRYRTYLDALWATPHTLQLALAIAMANYTGKMPGLIPWASDYLIHAFDLFRELVDPARVRATNIEDRNGHGQHSARCQLRRRARNLSGQLPLFHRDFGEK